MIDGLVFGPVNRVSVASSIRIACETDLCDVASIHVASWRDAYRGALPDEVLDTLSQEGSLQGWRSTHSTYPNNLTVACTSDGAIIGFCCAGPVVNEVRSGPFGFEIYGLHVAPESRQRAVGAALLRQALTRARYFAANPSAIVWTLRELHPSRRFYEREGGVLVKTGKLELGTDVFPEVAYGWQFASPAQS